MGRILITGGAGYIGSHAVYAALDKGYEVTVIDNLSTGCLKNLPLDKISFFEADVADEKIIDKIFLERKPQAIMHFAGSVVVPESIENPIKYYENNFSKALILIKKCIEHKLSSFLFSSTAAVYRVSTEPSIEETDPCDPLSPYGQSKLMVEKALEDIAKAHDFTYAALRYFNVAGCDPKGRTGQSNPRATHIIKVACQTALKQRDYFPLYGTDYATKDGSTVRDFIHVSDLVEAHFQVLSYIQKERSSIILNCGNGKGYSMKEVIAAVQAVSGQPFPVREEPRRAGDAPIVIANPEKIRALTGWSARHTDLNEIVKSAFDWEKAVVTKTGTND